MEITNLIRRNILELNPYSTARDECKMQMDIYLDANESPFDNGINRYPSPMQKELKDEISTLFKINVNNIFVGNGSDEAIDIIFRIFCTPSKDSIIAITPSYGMYKVAAQVNDIKCIEYKLNNNFDINAQELLMLCTQNTKIIFLCSPNNPTGNLLNKNEIIKIIENFNGIVVVDQAYIDFANDSGFTNYIVKYPNLIVLQTLSKGYGMAGLRVGLAFANQYVISIMNKVKYPYNISKPCQDNAIELLQNILPIKQKIELIVKERERVVKYLSKNSMINKIYPSSSNFILIEFKEKDKIFNLLKDNGIIVRDRSSLPLCDNCLRITIGNPKENDKLLRLLNTPIIEEPDNKLTKNKREIFITRKTKETSVQIHLNLDLVSPPYISTKLNFFNHMLEQIGYHSGIKLNILCNGDINVDCHHTIEDVAIALGDALNIALGKRDKISRYAFSLPMDEADILINLDLGGRIDFKWDVIFKNQYIGDVNSQMFEHFFKTIAQNLKCNLHITAKGDNDHHIVEGVFKGFARALKQAIKEEDNIINSSKGCL